MTGLKGLMMTSLRWENLDSTVDFRLALAISACRLSWYSFLSFSYYYHEEKKEWYSEAIAAAQNAVPLHFFICLYLYTLHAIISFLVIQLIHD